MDGNILDVLYPPENKWVLDYHFFDDERAIEVVCRVPLITTYTRTPVPYVSAENYYRCVSQAGYLLAGHVLECDLIPPIRYPISSFREAAMAYRIYYHKVWLDFHRKVAVDEEFKIRLRIRRAQEFKTRLRAIVLFLKIERGVISGKVNFVMPR